MISRRVLSNFNRVMLDKQEFFSVNSSLQKRYKQAIEDGEKLIVFLEGFFSFCFSLLRPPSSKL
jgi:hypothetical protein